MKEIAENLRAIATMLDEEDEKIKQNLCLDMIDDINNLNDILILSGLMVVTPEESSESDPLKDRPLCIIAQSIIEYEKGNISAKFALSDYDLDEFLIKHIEKISIEKELDIQFVIDGVINYLVDCQTIILKHFNIGPEYYNE